MSINWNNSRCIESSPLDVTNISRVTRFKMALFFDSNMFHCSVSYRNSMFLETQRDTFVNHLTQLTIRWPHNKDLNDMWQQFQSTMFGNQYKRQNVCIVQGMYDENFNFQNQSFDSQLNTIETQKYAHREKYDIEIQTICAVYNIFSAFLTVLSQVPFNKYWYKHLTVSCEQKSKQTCVYTIDIQCDMSLIYKRDNCKCFLRRPCRFQTVIQKTDWKLKQMRETCMSLSSQRKRRVTWQHPFLNGITRVVAHDGKVKRIPRYRGIDSLVHARIFEHGIARFLWIHHCQL